MHTNNTPALLLCHANAKRTGCAVRITLHPAHDSSDGFISLEFANQSQKVGFPGFEWKNPITVKLYFSEVCKVLEVLRGYCESIEDGKGIFIRSLGYCARFSLRHMVEPVSGYSLEVFKRDLVVGVESSAHIVISQSEALGLSCAFEQVLGVLAFGRFNAEKGGEQ